MDVFIESTNKKERITAVILKALEDGAEAVCVTQCTDCGNYLVSEQYDSHDEHVIYCKICE